MKKPIHILLILILSSTLNAQWIWQHGISNSVLMKTKFSSNNIGYSLVRLNVSQIIKTTNTGINWVVYNTIKTSNQLNSLSFPDDATGWIVGQNGSIFKTTNGALNWVSQNGGGSSYLRSVFFIDINTGWIAGNDGVILKTIN